MFKPWTILTVKNPKRRFPRQVLREPRQVYDFVKEYAALDREYVFRLDLDVRHRAIGLELISVGTLDGALVHPREFLKGALLQNSYSVLMVHTHPSGDPEPSFADIDMTRRLFNAGQLLRVDLLDHIVVGRGRYFSFKEHGIFPKAEDDTEQDEEKNDA
jgi:DNA repair protein RadC